MTIELAMPRARRGDPVTSHMAAERAGKFANGHKDRILDTMRRWGGTELTAHQIANGAGLTVVQVDRRLVEMERAGLIETTGQIVDGFRCWRLV